MKKIFTFLICLTSLLAFSQSKVDSLIVDIYKKSIDDRIVIRTSESKLFVSYKFCNDWKAEIKYLQNELNEEQNSELISDENGTFNLIGLLSNFTKHNNKEYAMSQLDKLSNEETKIISDGCGDAFTSLTLKEFYLKLLTEPNNFIQPTFKLSQEEINLIEKKFE